MQSSTFRWLGSLKDEDAYRFLEEVVDLAQRSGSPTGFLRSLDSLVLAWVPPGSASPARQASATLGGYSSSSHSISISSSRSPSSTIPPGKVIGSGSQ